jgi:hypothetical protein
LPRAFFLHNGAAGEEPADNTRGIPMRKAILLIAAAALVAAPSLALAATAKKKPAGKPAAAEDKGPVDNSKFFKDAMHQWVVPFESMAAGAQKSAEPAKKTAAKKSKKS